MMGLPRFIPHMLSCLKWGCSYHAPIYRRQLTLLVGGYNYHQLSNYLTVSSPVTTGSKRSHSDPKHDPAGISIRENSQGRPHVWC